MKEIIEQFIRDDQTEDALNELSKHTSDGILLLARFNSGKKQYNMGLINFEDWQRIKNGINASAVDLAATLDKKPPAVSPLTPPSPSNGPKVFISYNHRDKEHARAIREFLEQNGIAVTIDEADLQPGGNIEQFINESLKKVDFVVSVVSRNSLQSTWVSTESTMGMILHKTTEKAFIPVSLDDAVFNADFYFESVDAIEAKIKEARANIAKALERNISSRPFQDELNRFEDAKNHLGQIIDQLKAVLMTDISGDAFASGMGRVVQRIRVS